MQPGTPSRPVPEFTELGGASAAMYYPGAAAGERAVPYSRLMDYTPISDYETTINSPASAISLSSIPNVGYAASPTNGRPTNCYNNTTAAVAAVIPPNASQVIVGNPEYTGSVTPTSHHHGTDWTGTDTAVTTSATTPTRDGNASTDSNHHEQYYYFRSCNSTGSNGGTGYNSMHNGNQQGHHQQQPCGISPHFQNFAQQQAQHTSHNQYGNNNNRHLAQQQMHQHHQQYSHHHHPQQHYNVHHHHPQTEYGSTMASTTPPNNQKNSTSGSPGASLNLSHLSDNTNDSSGSSGGGSCCGGGNTHNNNHHHNSRISRGAGGNTPIAATTPTELVAIGATTEMVSAPYPGYTSVIVDPHRLTDYDCVNCS